MSCTICFFITFFCFDLIIIYVSFSSCVSQFLIKFDKLFLVLNFYLSRLIDEK